MKYSIIAMYELAKHYNLGTMHIGTIAENQNLPKNYLVQLLNILKHNNLLKSVRGASGGYILKKPPGQISLLEIIEAIEGSIDIVEDANKEGGMGQFWVKTEEKIRELFKISLEDLINMDSSLNFVI